MIARHLPARTGEEAIRVIRALGTHRYLAGRLHSVHALVFDAAAAATDEMDASSPLSAACLWASETLADPTIEPDSKDPRLFRLATADELLAALACFWIPGLAADRAHERLLENALDLGLDVPRHEPFDEAAEDEMHPLLIDAGWELLPLAELDPVRHRGVIEAFGEPILYDAARFEEENAVPRQPPLQELPALGIAELLRGVNAEGELVEPLVLWTGGDDVYQDYLLRGVLKVAKIEG
jgi:hypothetical protein